MPAQLLTTSAADVAIAAAALRDGKLVALPTETVYGLGANALDPVAVARIFEAKQRPHFDPLIVHIASEDALSTLASEVSPLARRLIDAFWPGPLTLILPRTDHVPSLVTSGLSTVAVRMPSHPVALDVIGQAGVPVAAPSANPFGRLSPTRVAHVVDGLGDSVDYIVDGGSTSFGVESTIVDVTSSGVARVLRHGALVMEDIAAVAGEEMVVDATSGSATPEAPGQLPQHYAPRTRLVCVENGAVIHDAPNGAGFLGFSPGENVRSGEFAAIGWLSKTGDMREAAANLFEALHMFDGFELSVIYAELVPEEGLGRAINDRLRRAAATFG